MEENKDLNQNIQEDFSDFAEEDFEMPKPDEDFEEDFPQEETEEIPENPETQETEEIKDELKTEDDNEIEVPNFNQDETESLETDEEIKEEEIKDELSITPEEFEQTEEIQEKETPEISHWEELSSDNSVVKKYIVYISKDFVPYIDSLTVDERTAYINDAIQKKIDLEDEQSQQDAQKRVKTHLILTILTFIIMTPIALLGVNKAIMLTFENYKYSQDNFEKLYKQRFEKDKIYMRSLQYNKEQAKKRKAK